MKFINIYFQFFCFLFILVYFSTSQSLALVTGSISAREGETEVELRSTLHRGLLGPQNLPETLQTQSANFTEHSITVGHNFGTSIIFSDFTIRLSADYFESAAETLNSAPIYPSDDGTLIGAEVGVSLLRNPDYLLGTFIRSKIPLGVNTHKFMKPNIDTIGVGILSGFKMNYLFSNESLIYFGSGLFTDNGRKENQSLAMSSFFVLRFTEWFANEVTFKLGPFLQSDLTQRDDSAYRLQGFRSFKLGVNASMGVKISNSFGIELSHAQKLSGAYFKASRATSLSIKTTF